MTELFKHDSIGLYAIPILLLAYWLFVVFVFIKLLSISTFIFMGHTEGCYFLLLGAIINLIGVSKKKHYPEGFQSGVLGNPNVHSVSSINTKFAKEEFSTEAQYKDCRSPHAYVPHEGEDVFYFPQGHLEQIEASMSHGLNQQLPAFFLPTKILCKVVNDQLWVEEDSEQVYAQVTLLPHQDQSEVAIHNHPMPEPRCCNVCSFYETPTACDTSAPGGLRKHTHLSVLATAHHAVTAITLFTVIYKPRATQSAFIISVNRYLNAQNPKPCVGMKFTMGFENEMVLEERFGGTIVAVGDEASSKWPESEWKSLKVQWVEPSPILPDRLSLW